MVKIFKTILIRVVGVGMTVKVQCGRVFNPILVTSILQNIQCATNEGSGKTYTILLFIKHKGGNGPTSVGTVPGLTANSDSGMANPVLVLSAGDSTRRGRH